MDSAEIHLPVYLHSIPKYFQEYHDTYLSNHHSSMISFAVFFFLTNETRLLQYQYFRDRWND